MNITIDKEELITNFLNPISKITEECTIRFSGNRIYSLVNDLSGNIILYCNITTSNELEEDLTLNIKDVRKFTKVLDCIPHSLITLDIDKNTSVIKYKSPEISFKLHLVTERAIRTAQISLEKMQDLTFDTEFTLSKDKLSDILKGCSFATETNKIYFYSEQGNIYAELTDKTTQDIDSVTFAVTDKYEGVDITSALPFSLEILRILVSNKIDEFRVKINNTYKLVAFETKTDQSESKYLIPAMTK
jgi:hypothetical protein